MDKNQKKLSKERSSIILTEKEIKLIELLLNNSKPELRASELFKKPKKSGLKASPHQDDFYWNVKGNKNGIFWEKKGTDEVGRRSDTGEIVIRIDPKYYRPTEVNELLGDASKAKRILEWKPKISLQKGLKIILLF